MSRSLSEFSTGLFRSMGVSTIQSGFDCGESTGRECVIMIDGLGRNAITEFSESVPTLNFLKDERRYLHHFLQRLLQVLRLLQPVSMPEFMEWSATQCEYPIVDDQSGYLIR